MPIYFRERNSSRRIELFKFQSNIFSNAYFGNECSVALISTDGSVTNQGGLQGPSQGNDENKPPSTRRKPGIEIFSFLLF